LVSDDGARLRLDGRLLIDSDRWRPFAHHVEVDLSDQPSRIQVEHFQ
jgi:hypothetical protein